MIKIPVLSLSFILAASTASYAVTTTSKNLDITVTAVSPTGGNEEFVGPFSTWSNVKTNGGCAGVSGASGDDVADDTVKIQTCLNTLSASTPVIYFPCGTYRVNRTVYLKSRNNISIIGEDPNCTIIKWTGGSLSTTDATFTASVGSGNVLTVASSPTPTGKIVPGQRITGTGIDTVVTAYGTGTGGAGTYTLATNLTLSSRAMTTQNTSMLFLDGVAYSRIDRLTFDGQNTAHSLVNQSWDGFTNFADTANQYADVVFKGGSYGFTCGVLLNQCSEVSMIRDKWINNSGAGIGLFNGNALDVWVWYGLFQNNAIGLTNPAGSFHVYNSKFESSTTADILFNQTGIMSFRDNYSTGTRRFIDSAGATDNAANITIQGNTILDTTDEIAIVNSNLGPTVLVDNIIRSKLGATNVAAFTGSFSPGDMFSMGNTFTTNPGSTASGHFHSVLNTTVDRATLNPTPPTLPGVPPNLGRTIFEVTSGMTRAQIQTVITNACTAGGTRNVVHIQVGSYSIDSTLTVPANCDVQIIGDGGNSILAWSAGGTGPVLKLSGPAKATLAHFLVTGNSKVGNGIEIDNADQTGARVFYEGPFISNSTTGIRSIGLDKARVEVHNIGALVTTNAVIVTGGTAAALGTTPPLGSGTYFFSGSTAGNTTAWNISNSANVLIDDVFNDSGAGGSLIMDVTGQYGAVSFVGAATYLVATPAIRFNAFRGTMALVNVNMNGTVSLLGTSTGANDLGLGMIGPNTSFFSNTASGNTFQFLNGRLPANGAALTEIGDANSSFMTTTLAQIRGAHPTIPSALAAGITDARLYRVYLDQTLTGLHVH